MVTELEDTIYELSTVIGSIKNRIAVFNAHYAVAAKKQKKEAPTYKEILEDLLGGQVIAIDEGGESGERVSGNDTTGSNTRG